METFITIVISLIVGGFLGYVFGFSKGEHDGYNSARTIYGPEVKKITEAPVKVPVKTVALATAYKAKKTSTVKVAVKKVAAKKAKNGRRVGKKS